jgi:SEL1 protein
MGSVQPSKLPAPVPQARLGKMFLNTISSVSISSRNGLYVPLISIQFNADRGETDFAFRLGKIFYHGSIYHAPGGMASGGEGVGRVPRDFERALYYFESIARQVWPNDSGDVLGRRDENSPVALAAPAAGYLGRMYLRGEGVRMDLRLAKLWFERGAAYGDKECHNGLGIIWRDGLIEGRKDSKKYLAHFTVAAGQDLAEAQVNLGKHHYRRSLEAL